MLASDLMNPAFVGAKNPDDMLAVEFYYGVVKDWRGKPVLDEKGREEKVPYVRISVPGNDTMMLDTPVRESHKKRFSRQWQYFQLQDNTAETADIPGWRLDDWSEIEDEQKRELKYLRFSVVEQIATASDMQLQRMGMGGAALKLKAQNALRKRHEETVSREIRERDERIKELEAKEKRRDEDMEAIKAQMAQLLERRPPGRPPKVKDEAN